MGSPASPFAPPGESRPPGPAPRHRLRGLLWRWRHAVAAACLGCAAAVALGELRPPPEPATTMLVARRELTAGRTLTAEDVRRASVPDRLLPASAASSAPPDVTGRAPAVDLPAGTLLTEALLAPERLDGAPAGTALVPVRLADDAVTALLRPGDRVDLLDATRPALAPESDAPAPDVSESIAAGPGAAASGAPTSAHGGASAPDSGSPATPSDQRVLARGALVMPQPAARAAAASPGLLGGAPTEDATSPLLLVAVQPSEAVAVAALSGRSAISAVIVR